MRKFEKITYNQFEKDTGLDIKTYESYMIPKRQTKGSAGYDFETLKNYVIKPNESIKIPTGVKVQMNLDEVLMIFVRSSMGIKFNMRLCNQVGIIDSDYYGNKENEGHIWIAVKNEGNNDIILDKGQRFAQGIFVNFLTTDNEEEIKKERTGSTGSTDKED